MRREQAYETALDALARLQHNVSLILEAKAAEAEKVRNWTLHHFSDKAFPYQPERLDLSLKIHEQQVEMIEALTKLCNGLAQNLKAIIGPGPGEDGGMVPSSYDYGAGSGG